jgi:hypothetical protein
VSLFSQIDDDTEFYLLTCGPGTATYSIYGHSAIRIVMPQKQSDMVYNWGVFDFSTPNFVWKFAKGRLNYKLDVYPYDRFMQEYFLDKRSVYSQKINLELSEKETLYALIIENLLPENRYYRYDFFYDDCSTRIRDLIEKTIGKKLIYPPDEKKRMQTFREKVGEYQRPYPWLKMGVDLIMGTPGEKKASFRDVMFLPIDLQRNLTAAVINRDYKMIPLLQPSSILLDFSPPEEKNRFYTSPFFVFSLLFVLIVLISAFNSHNKLIKVVDIMIFALFSVLSLLMIFFNFFTGHQQMKWNLNIIWFNPFIFFCLFALLFKNAGQLWFRLVFYLSFTFVPLIIIVPDAINSSFVPVILILALRSSARTGFSWNPLTVSQ